MIFVIAFAGNAAMATARSTNLALGKPYRFSDVAVYHYCSGAEDATDLTDGTIVGGSHAWTKQGMVGWQGVIEPVAVEVDLGEAQPIDAVHVSSYWGNGSSVFLPDPVAIGVSDDGTTYHRVATLRATVDQTGPGQGRYVFGSKGLKTRGRYVLVQMTTTGSYLFCDEIEVLAGAHEPGHARFPAGSGFRFTQRLRAPDAFPFPELQGKSRRVAIARMAELAGAARWLVDHAASSHPRDQELAGELAGLRPAEGAELTAEDYERIRDEVLTLSTEATRRRWGPDKTTLWWTNPWLTVRPIDAPQTAVEEPVVTLSLAADEVAPAALMVANASGEDILLGASLTGAEGTPRLAWFHAHDESAPDRLTSNPLPRLDALKEPPRIPPGETRQIWLACDAGDLGPGRHVLMLEVTDAGEPMGRARLEVTVDDAALPPCSIGSVSWDYLGNEGYWADFGKGRERWFVEDMAAHGFTHLMLDNNTLPRGQFDESGKLTQSLDFTVTDRALELRGKEMSLIVFFYAGVDRYIQPRIERSPAARERAIQTWFGEVSGYLAERGWGPERVLYYPYDEVTPTSARAQAELICIVHTAHPKIEFFSTAFRSILGTPGEATILGTIDYPITWCLSGRLDRVEAFAKAKKRPWGYEVFRQWMDPYEHGRLAWWRAVKHNLAGVGFWAFYSTRKPANSPWEPGYTMVYDGRIAPFGTDEVVIPSKKYEAWRQGWIDARYIQLARSRGDAAGAAIDELVDRVLGKPEDHTLADEARAELRKMIGLPSQPAMSGNPEGHEAE